MKPKKVLVVMLTVWMLASSFSIQGFAANTNDVQIQPRFSNVDVYMVDFDIDPTGLASIYFDYEGREGVITGARAEIYLEKRFLGIFWTRVDIGESDNVWIDTFSGTYGYVDHTIQLEDTGTYRATFNLTFTGTNTTDDVIEKTIEATYD